VLSGRWLSAKCRCCAGSLRWFLNGAVYDSLLPLPGVLFAGIKRDHGCSIGKLFCPDASHLDQVVDAVTRDAQPPCRVCLCHTFKRLSHIVAYSKMKSQS
jgi:hypothetical protein